MEGEGCMGYNLKTTYSDLAELEKGQVATISDIIGSNTPGTQRAKGGRIFDLKLGNAGDLGNGLVNGFKDHRVSTVESLPMTARLSKRGRVPSSGSQSVSCLVDGCKSDLSKCRDYHRRHKVCELHSKTPRVTIRGQEQRFCQQCSRFHSLPEFDEGKRSCRKRLEGHNRRRRKPQPANPATFLPRAPGDRFIQFTTSPITPSTSTASSTWSRVSKPGSNAAASYSATACGIYSNAYKGRHFPFLQGSDSSHSSSSGGSNYPGMWCSSGLNGQVMENNVALSLLSSSTAQTLEMGLERMSEPTAMAPFVQTGMQYGSGSESYSGSQGALGGHRGGSGLLFENGVFPGGMDGGAHQTLSFSWE